MQHAPGATGTQAARPAAGAPAITACRRPAGPVLSGPAGPSFEIHAERATAVAEPVPRPRPAPELPDLLDRADALADRDVDAADGDRLARPRAERQRLSRRARRVDRLAPDPALLVPRRRPGRPPRQA